jgi:lipopolysaccharide/colanic/teichoic acid biosynthesis glycosyltransferase
VTNGRHGVAYPQRAEIELAYVRHPSLLGDLRILLATAKAVLRPGGE